jgi:drug/metabolite transporter (DMT)-like permease
MSEITLAKTEQRRRILAALMVLVSAICFSGKAIMIKLAYRYSIDSVSLLTLRMLFSLPFFLLNAWIGNYRMHGQPDAKPLLWRDWVAIIALGFSGYYCASLLDFLGLQYITAGLERLILYLYPTYLGIAVALVDPSQLGSGKNLWLGIGLIFFSGFTYAIYLVGSGAYVSRVGSMRYTSYAMIAATVAIVIHSAFLNHLQLWHYAAPVYWLVLIMAIFSTVLPTLMISEGIRIIGASNTSIIGSIGPVATIGLGYLFLGETFGVWQMFGTLFVIIGVLWISLSK